MIWVWDFNLFRQSSVLEMYQMECIHRCNHRLRNALVHHCCWDWCQAYRKKVICQQTFDQCTLLVLHKPMFAMWPSFFSRTVTPELQPSCCRLPPCWLSKASRKQRCGAPKFRWIHMRVVVVKIVGVLVVVQTGCMHAAMLWIKHSHTTERGLVKFHETTKFKKYCFPNHLRRLFVSGWTFPGIQPILNLQW